MIVTNGTDKSIGHLEAMVTTLAEAVESSAQEGREGRRAMYKGQEQLRLDMSHSKRSIKDISDRLNKMEPTISELDKWKQRAIGGWSVIVIAAATIGAAFAMLSKWLFTKVGL